MTGEDKTAAPGKEPIAGLFAQSVTKNVRSRSSRAATVRYIARNAFQNANRATGLTQGRVAGPEEEIFHEDAVSIKDEPEEGKGTLKRIILSFRIEKNVPKKHYLWSRKPTSHDLLIFKEKEA